MLSYIIKLLTLIVFGGFSVFSYYKLFPFHVEGFPVNVITSYFVPLIVVYSIYKILSLFVFNSDRKDEVEMSYAGILGYGLIHLMILCIVYFSLKNGFSGGQGVKLFISILGFLILPIIIFSSTYGFGNKILSYIKGFEKEEFTFRFLSSFGFGFFSFIVSLFISGFLGLYNIYSLIIILMIFIGVGYIEILNIYKVFFTKKVIIKKDISLYTSEFLFVILTALISTNLILVFRPFPIGWDDLGVYMNVPNLIASAGKLLSIGGMQAWELYTGIGFIFGSTTQAFYLNTFSGIVASLIVYLFIKSFLPKNNEFINIPLLLVTIFISMPMVIFQLGKDMKLDIGLFSISLIAMYMVYYIFVKKEEFVGEEKSSLEENNEKIIGKVGNFINKIFKHEFFKKEDFYYMFIAGIIVGFAFAIKMTSLMLISAVIGLIIFSRIGFDAFLGYLAIYFAIFTKLKLWDTMNVVYPKDDITFINNFSIISLSLGIGLLAYAYVRHNKEYILKTVQILGIFLAGIIVSLSPRLVKNITEVGVSKISIGSLLGGNPITFTPDYTKLHSKEKIDVIKKEIESRQSIDNNGQAINADLGRYFGYEKGINNYLKIPYSLSMQTNQRGEYTDITYIFFALLPALFLFLPLKKAWYYIGIYFILLFEIFYYIFPSTRPILTGIFDKIDLPLGYAIIFGIFIGLLLYFKNTTEWKKDKVMKLFIVNLTFSVFYVFLWNISAFGIVWYGITMYMCFLIFLGIGIYYVTIDNDKIDNNDNFYILKVLNFFAIFIIISIYFVKSSIPHIFTNYNEDSYMHYKAGLLKEDEAIFTYHNDYLNILFELNIKEELKADFVKGYKKEAYDFFAMNNYPPELKDAVERVTNITQLNELLSFFIYSEEMKKNMDATNYQKMKKRLSEIRSNIYKNITSPKKEIKSDAIIYRMGTFLKYFITDNNYRLIEDSLIFSFADYIYDEDINKTIDNFKKLGMEYIVVDLNTPTIDKDPAHTLTTRFENLLKTFTSQRLQIVDTDSLCLRVGIDLYNGAEKNKESLNNYVRLAGVNFESYDKNNQEISRTSKLIKCYDVMFYLFDNNLVNEKNFSYLIAIKDDYKKQTFTNNDEKYKYLFTKVPAGYKAIFKIVK